MANHPDVLSWKDLVELGKSEDENRLVDRHKRMAVNQCAMLVYTSGTTGMPKGSVSADELVLILESPTVKKTRV